MYITIDEEYTNRSRLPIASAAITAKSNIIDRYMKALCL